MDNLSGFLRKFTHLLHHKEYVSEVCTEVLQEVLGVSIDTNEIKIKNKILTTNISSGHKAQLFIKKQHVMKKINQKIGKVVIVDIR